MFLRSIIATCLLLLTAGVAVSAEKSSADEAMARELHRQNRGLVALNNEFVPKDQWVVGVTASYSAHLNKDYTLALVEGINSEGYTVKASPIVAYAINTNMAVGGRFEYGRSLLRIDSATLSLGDGDDALSLEVKDYYSLRHSYTGMILWRQYIPLGISKRFALFAETRLEAGGVQYKLAFDQPVTGTYATGYNVGLGVVPGIVAFATNNVAFEISVGMVGIHYSHLDQVHNQVYVGEIDSSDFSFKINLLSVGLGVAVYL